MFSLQKGPGSEQLEPVKAEWKITETNRRARFYTLTAAGRKQLGIEVTEFEQMIAAIGRVLSDAQEA